MFASKRVHFSVTLFPKCRMSPRFDITQSGQCDKPSKAVRFALRPANNVAFPIGLALTLQYTTIHPYIVDSVSYTFLCHA